jgi:hypothetical protein
MKITFVDEPARVKAIEELGDKPENLDKLKEVMEAPIGPPEPVVEVPKEIPKETPKEIPKEIPKETPKDALKATEPPVEPKTFTLTDKDLPSGFDSPGKVFKSYGEAQDLVKRQGEKIKELLSNQNRPTGEQSALERAEKAEKELERLRGGKPKQETSADITAVNADIQRIDALQAELEKLAEDPDAAYTADYQKKARELSKLQTKNFNVLTGLLTKAQQEIAETRKNTTEFSEFVQGQQQSLEQQRRVTALQETYKEVDGLAETGDEFKLSKPSKEVEQAYVGWRDDVSLAYYSRPAKNTEEKFAALDQLKLKNPDLISKLRVMGVSEEPTDDIKKFINICEMIDYREGYRTDPHTGKVERLFKTDIATGKQVPLVLPSLKAAIQQKRIEDGYYDKQVDGAFQKGAQSVAEAAQRRDKGAVELNAHEDIGQTQDSQAWAQRILENADSEKAKYEYDHGKPEKFDEINKARKIFGLEPITFNEG